MKVLTERHGPVVTVILNRPEVRNAVDPETAGLLKAAFDDFERIDDLKVAVLWGEGETFCAGYDLASLAGATVDDLFDPEGDGPMGPSRMPFTKPVIAAVEGYAVAGGLELSLMCDLRVASETAVFGVFCRRWGVPLVDGGTVRLPRLIGQSRALDMILTGRPVEAEEAHAWGLANRLVTKGKARAEAETLAAQIARFPNLCMRTDRLSAFRQWDFSLAEALKNEGREGLAPLVAEAQSGAARFRNGKGRGGNFGDI